MNDEKIVCDSIFGFITLKPYIISFIDIPEFQRLRNIWQLGVVPFVYPSANHSRFVHSIGTYWLASKLVTQLQKQLKFERSEKQISDKDVMCVEIAALLHDIGHGPFSHFWDKVLLPAIFGKNFLSHEKLFPEIWEILKSNKKVENIINKYELNETLIANLIKGEGEELLCDIVNNSVSGMDVDKWDYLARDSTGLGQASTNFRIEIERMIHFSRANKDDDGKWRISFRDSEALNMFRVYQLRHYHYQTAYCHRTAVTIDVMLLDGIRQCIDNRLFSQEELRSASWIIKNTDAIFWSNFNAVSAFSRILTRDLYRPLFEAVKYEIDIDVDDVKSKCLGIENNESNFRLVKSEFKLGNKNGNPMFKIPFYNKNKKTEIFYYDKKSLPLHLNMNCNETRLTLLSVISSEQGDNRNNYDNDKIKAIQEYFENNNWTIQNIK